MLFEQRRGKPNVTSLVERGQSFHGDPLKNPNQRHQPVMGKILKAIKDPAPYRPQIHHL